MADQNVISEIVLRAARLYAEGVTTFDVYMRTMAFATLWAQGVECPTEKQVEARIKELELANSFIGSAPVPEG